MSVCVHGNLCRDIHKKTGFIYSKKCPAACPYFEEKYKQDKEEPTDDATLKDILCMGCEYKEQEPRGDLISRQAVENALYDALYEYSENNDVIYNLIITEYIDTIPSVKIGHMESEDK